VAEQERTLQMATKTVQMPSDLLAAIEGVGELSRDQFRQLFEIESESIGLTFDEAIAAARSGTLPKNPIGFDLDFIASIIDAPTPEND
jgi:hypothetical protein